ncbi:hypothetical protein TWF694_002860 [Orbilia ellipsospora]|uniref:Nucleoside phosphorylase domain-containing protein n=1 Tax=Orbilia ellipsospora TaxID=2528407 RepID=A0AAV9X0T9_9PEZI
MSNGHNIHYDKYVIAVISASEFEMSAFRFMLESEHPRLPIVEGDRNTYILGELNGYNIVLACLPGNQGKGAAAVVATNLERTFHCIQWRFLVGIGGGVPNNKHDIRLGDVVISMPSGQHGGVVQYDLGKEAEDEFQLKGLLSPPPTLLRSVAEAMKSDHRVKDNRVNEFISTMLQKGRRLRAYDRPSKISDNLYAANYPHIAGELTCSECSDTHLVIREPREFDDPVIHYGLIASGDRVMKSGQKRDKICRDVGEILCFEMEAAGISTEYSCIVIRGISDYADSHKNDDWQYYAAATAAAATKELISYLGPGDCPNHTDPNLDSTTRKPLLLTQSQFQGVGIQNSGSGSISVGRDVYMHGA